MLVLAGIIALNMMIFAWFNSRKYHEVESDVAYLKDFLEQSETKSIDFRSNHLHYEEIIKIGSYIEHLIVKRNNDAAILTSQYDMITATACELEESNASLEEEIQNHSKTIDMLNISEKYFSSVVEALPDVIFLLDRQGYFLNVFSGEKDWLLFEEEEIIGKSLFELFPPYISQNSIEKIKDTLDTNSLQIFEYYLEISSITNYFEVRFVAFYENTVLAIIRDVTTLKQSQLTTEYLCYHDQLTGAYNRRYFDEAIVKLDKEDCMQVSIAILDVNGLKLTNDAFGHKLGDELLVNVTRILQEHTNNEKDFIARIGGDEFAIICPNTNSVEMKKKVEKIYKHINKDNEKYPVMSVSIGWATKSDADLTVSEIFTRAEESMYEKKLTESQSMRNQTVQVIMKTLNEKNTREKIHSERVSTIAKKIGQAMELDYNAVKELETAGLLHDIGKIAISDDILNKSGGLTEEEYAQIKKHPESSYQILKTIDVYAAIADDVLSHHERWDGRGYPRGLKGKEIPLSARIITLADSYEAMTSDRSYRDAMAKEQALEEIKNGSGSQFDPEIVNVFVEKVYEDV